MLDSTIELRVSVYVIYGSNVLRDERQDLLFGFLRIVMQLRNRNVKKKREIQYSGETGEETSYFL